MSAIEKAAAMLRREAESMKECHTVGVGGEWDGESAKAEYYEMIAAADAAIAERAELLVALRCAVNDADAWGLADDECDWLSIARKAIARATGEQP